MENTTVMAATRIASETLNNLLNGPLSTKLLLIDCRSFLAYNSGHIVRAHNVHCPPIVKRRTGGCLSLENILRCEDARMRLKTGYYTSIVLYDEKTADISLIHEDSIISLVLKGLINSDTTECLFYLYGGFEAFNAGYPESCTNHISSETETPITFQVQEHVSCMDTSPYITVDAMGSPQKTETTAEDTVKYRPSQDQGDPEAILPWLYLGSAYHATQENRLQNLGINALLSLSRFDNHTPSGSFINRSFGVDDDCMSDIRCWFPEAIDFIESVRKNGGKVLVHCHAGISRSATVCIAYIMWLKHWTMEYAYQFLKSKRSLIAPNLNFMRQLVEFENELEENGRGPTKLSSLSSGSSHSSVSSYASAMACLDCDPLAMDERPCALCSGEIEDVTAFSSPRSASLLRHRDNDVCSSARDIFSSPCGHLDASLSSRPSKFSFEIKHHPTAPPKSASDILLSGLKVTACELKPRSPGPATAQAKLFTLPLVTTCAQQVFSFDSPVCSTAIPPPHTNSPPLCHSPLLSPG